MKTVSLIQGSAEWHAHRRAHFNASDAPAMMGCSPYKTRTQLLGEYATGITQEVDASTQRRFEDGHRYEALARPFAEQVIGEDLYPIVGVEGKLSASFDGLTLMNDTIFEHKSLNDDLRAVMVQGCTGADLPLQYRVQMEQQCMVSGAKRVLFMASKWSGATMVEERHCWYESDKKLAQQIMIGWGQFADDLEGYEAPARAEVVVAAPVQSLPSVSVVVSGEIAVRDNFKAFEVALRDFLEHRLIREPKTDQDFADLDTQIKAMKGAEAALDSAEAQMLAQIQTVDEAKKTKEMLAKLVRDNRLMAEKLLASEKERRRSEIVAVGVSGLREHIAALNKRLGESYMPAVPADFGAAIKGKKSLSSMEDAVSTELARAKIAANEIADRIQFNMRVLIDAADKASFPDAATLVLKAPDDLRAIVAQRAAEVERKLEEQRERIRQEEAAKLKREADAAAAVATPASAPPAVTPAPAPAVHPTTAPRPSLAASAATIKLGDINARLAPIQITADGLSQLGFQPVGTERAAKLYRERDFAEICHRLTEHLHAVAEAVPA